MAVTVIDSSAPNSVKNRATNMTIWNNLYESSPTLLNYDVINSLTECVNIYLDSSLMNYSTEVELYISVTTSMTFS